MNSALRRLHARKQYRLTVFRVVCECLLAAVAIGALVGAWLAISFVSQL